MTNPDANGEQGKACIVKIVSYWEKYNKEEEEERHQLLKDLEHHIVYDLPRHLKNDQETYDFDHNNLED